MKIVTFTGVEVIFIVMMTFLLFIFILLGVIFYYQKRIMIYHRKMFVYKSRLDYNSRSELSKLSDEDWKHGVKNLIAVLDKVKPVKRSWIDFFCDYVYKIMDAIISWVDNLLRREKLGKLFFTLWAVFAFIWLLVVFTHFIIMTIQLVSQFLTS